MNRGGKAESGKRKAETRESGSSRRQEACPELVEGAHSTATRSPGKRSEPFDRLRVYLVTRLRPTGYAAAGPLRRFRFPLSAFRFSPTVHG